MAKFNKIYTMQGYDSHRSVHWQMVPLYGFRYVKLQDGAGLTVTSSNSSVCHVVEVKQSELPVNGRGPLDARDRCFFLIGITKGNAVIRASNASGTSSINLEVDIKPLKKVQIAFNFVKDIAGHQTRRVQAQAAQWVKEMNYIFYGQANILVSSKSTQIVTVSRDLGRTITTTTSGGTGEEAYLYPLGDPHASINMFLVWRMDMTDSTGDEDAFSDGTNIVFEDNAGRQVSETIAHEVGHVLGVSDQYTIRRQLMYGYTDSRGVDIPKDHVNMMNP